MKKIVIASSGASGANLAQKIIQKLPSSIEAHFIKTKHSQIVANKEHNITLHDNSDIAASIASGSFQVDAMIIAPCSMNTLAKITCGIADNLVTRAASVMIKEQKKLLLAPREMPFSAIALENMLKLSRLGIIIAPPVMAYYSNQQSLEEMEDFIIGKWFDLLNIEHNLYKRWGETDE
ncbi:UbiX family decarboxylase associated with menaquinone via futalosine [hydrothermal vent metagenome]|uniref:UbiX family decarboxylase associated with menaquinone via futalosine n=1 Tax=hydrothermal vent metagenome TaxID=652676 RepID=A0A1W1C6R3_9ZZZZ